MVEGTSLTEEHVAIIREVEAEMIAANSTNGDTERKKKTLAQHQSFIKEKRLKIRQALNDDALFLQYDEFNRNYLKNRRKGNKKK